MLIVDSILVTPKHQKDIQTCLCCVSGLGKLRLRTPYNAWWLRKG